MLPANHGLLLYLCAFRTAVMCANKFPPKIKISHQIPNAPTEKLRLSLTVDSLTPYFKNMTFFKNKTFEGDFCVHGKASKMQIGGVSVNGVGVVTVPFSTLAATAMKQVSTPAPFGLGRETIIDSKIRDCLQVEAVQINTTPLWDEGIQKVVCQAAIGLGLDPNQVKSKLYKLLMYEAGGHFKPHRDTEKEMGMFATLIVQFPSEFTGGELVVRHRGIERVFDFGTKDQSQRHEFQYVAMYADCEHELRKITSGHRLVMVYSLCWGGDCASLPKPPSLDTAAALAEALKNFHGQGCLLLEHQYTISSLAQYGLYALKGNDRLQAGALECASSLIAQDGQGGLELYIARATRTVVDHPDAEPWSKDARPEVQLSDGAVFAADGSTPSSQVLRRLSRIQLYRDVINKYGWKSGYENYFWCKRLARDDSIYCGDEDDWKFISRMDAWFKSATGDSVYFTGNEGNGEKTEYSCYMLVISRSEVENQLSSEDEQ